MTDAPDAVWLTTPQLAAWKKLVATVELVPGVLESQLQRDSDLTHFEYFTLAMLSEAPGRMFRMSELAAMTNSTLARLSHVIARLEKRGFVVRVPHPDDRRATNAMLTAEGFAKVVATAPGHAATVRAHIIGALDERDITDLDRVMGRILDRLDPGNRLHDR